MVVQLLRRNLSRLNPEVWAQSAKILLFKVRAQTLDWRVCAAKLTKKKLNKNLLIQAFEKTELPWEILTE